MTDQDQVVQDRFLNIDDELASFKENISREIEEYRVKMKAEIERAGNKLNDMEKNTIEKIEHEWKEYETRLEEYRVSMIEANETHISELKKLSRENNILNSLLTSVKREIYDSDKVEIDL